MASTFTSDTLPADHKAAIRQMKHALRAQLGDFPREDYETNWEGRFTLADLNIHGKRALGMDV